VTQAPSNLVATIGRFRRPGVPKYMALRDALAQAVASGALRAGSRLPNEAELAATLPVSLGTIQRALRALVDEGVIVRRQGHGTFVASRGTGQMHTPLHCRFLDDSGRAYLPVYPKVTARYAQETDGPWKAHLGSKPLLCVERILRIANEFRVFSRFYIDAARFPAFASLPLKRLSGENFKEIIWRESGLPIGRLVQFMSELTLPHAISSVLGVKKGSRANRLDIYGFAGKENPLYYQELYIPPNRRRLQLPGDGRDPGIDDASA
jgi:GntR family transcriptional regulator